MVVMVADAKGTPDDDGDAAGGPDIAPEPVRLGPAGQQRRDLRVLLGRQLRWPTGAGLSAQGLHALLAGALDPLAHGGATDAQRCRDVLLPPTLLVQLPGALAPPFPGVRSAL